MEKKKKAKPELVKSRQKITVYDDGIYVSGNTPEASCFMCGEKLANSGLKLAYLQPHCNTKNARHVGEVFQEETL